MPKIACGLHRLDWRLMRNMIEVILKGSGVKVTVCCYHQDWKPVNKNVDCYFCYNRGCNNGENCRYRHSPDARGTEEVCQEWLSDNCMGQSLFVHSQLWWLQRCLESLLIKTQPFFVKQQMVNGSDINCALLIVNTYEYLYCFVFKIDCSLLLPGKINIQISMFLPFSTNITGPTEVVSNVG